MSRNSKQSMFIKSRLLFLQAILFLGLIGFASTSGLAEVLAAPPPSGASFAIGYTDLSVGYRHACGVKLDGSVRCWGYSDQGNLGSLQSEYTRSTVPVVGITTAIAVSVGEFHACVLLRNGQVSCWGSNSFGQLGNRTTASSILPVAVLLSDGTPLSGVVDVVASKEGSCALRSDQSVTCWGAGFDGLLGDGSQEDRNFAGPVVSIANIIAIDAAYSTNRVCAVRSDGTAHCWGKSLLTSSRVRTPVQKVGISGATSISVGPSYACSTVSSNEFRCWDDWGAPADATAISGDIFTFSGLSVLSTGLGSANCLVMSDTTLRCWGSGWNGVLGTGSNSDRATPVLVKTSSSTTLSGVSRIEPGDSLTCALMIDTSIQCWGFSGYTARPWATWGTTETGFAGPISDSGPIRIDSIEYMAAIPTTNRPGLKVTVSGIQYCSSSLGFQPVIRVDISKSSTFLSNLRNSDGAFESCDGTGPFTSYFGLDFASSRHLLSELEPATTYFYRVQIISGFGNVSDDIRSFASPGKKPEINLGSSSMKQTSGLISFQHSSDGLPLSRIECLLANDPGMSSFMVSSHSSSAPGLGTCSFSNLKEGSTYFFKLRLTNVLGSTESDVREMRTLRTPGVSINAGDLYTNNANVVLNLTLPDGATVSVSNDGGFMKAKTFSSPSQPIAWTLDSAGDERLPKVVYVRVSSSGSDNVTITDDIILDTTAPKMSSASATTSTLSSGSVTVQSLQTKRQPKRTGVRLNVRASDANSGIGAMEIKSSTRGKVTRAIVASPNAGRQSVLLKTVKKRLWVRAVDRAGNPSQWKIVTVK